MEFEDWISNVKKVIPRVNQFKTTSILEAVDIDIGYLWCPEDEDDFEDCMTHNEVKANQLANKINEQCNSKNIKCTGYYQDNYVPEGHILVGMDIDGKHRPDPQSIANIIKNISKSLDTIM